MIDELEDGMTTPGVAPRVNNRSKNNRRPPEEQPQKTSRQLAEERRQERINTNGQSTVL